MRSKVWLAAPVLLAHAEVTENIIFLSMGPKLRYLMVHTKGDYSTNILQSSVCACAQRTGAKKSSVYACAHKDKSNVPSCVPGVPTIVTQPAALATQYKFVPVRPHALEDPHSACATCQRRTGSQSNKDEETATKTFGRAVPPGT